MTFHPIPLTPAVTYLLMSSTVAWRRGLMYDRFKDLHGNDEAKELCWFAPSRVMHPSLPQSFIDEEVLKDPVRAQAEYLNVWRSDSSSLIPADVIDKCIDVGVAERPPVPGVTYAAFCDPAFGTGADSYALSIAHAEPDGRVLIDVIRHREPRFVADAVIAEWSELLKTYGLLAPFAATVSAVA
jgi:hypothetical protein